MWRKPRYYRIKIIPGTKLTATNRWAEQVWPPWKDGEEVTAVRFSHDGPFKVILFNYPYWVDPSAAIITKEPPP